jgi:hypothetical protein
LVYVAGFERGVRPIGSLVDDDDLVDLIDAFDRRVHTHRFDRAVELATQRRDEDLPERGSTCQRRSRR